ncbi:hypothetical protein [Actinoallomurus sp. CA-142502]
MLKLPLERSGYLRKFTSAAADKGQDPKVLNYSDAGSRRCHGPANHGG